MRMGILGGTFNPPHLGHLLLAREARKTLNLDKVIFVPVNLPPHKESDELISSHHRLEMVKLALAENSDFAVSAIEVRRPGKSYSVDTLRELRKVYGKEVEFFFLTGSDSLEQFSSWKENEEILRLARFIVMRRPGYPARKLPEGITQIETLSLNISSTDIRRRVREGKTIKKLVPERVEKYILDKGLYH